jgi:hypothetical protein
LAGERWLHRVTAANRRRLFIIIVNVIAAGLHAQQHPAPDHLRGVPDLVEQKVIIRASPTSIRGQPCF